MLATKVASPRAPLCTAEELEEMRIAIGLADAQARAADEVERATGLPESNGTQQPNIAAQADRPVRRRARVRRRRSRPLRWPLAHIRRQREMLAAASMTKRPAIDFVETADTSVPVPLQDGDRHHAELPDTELPDIEWPGLSGLMMRLETGRAEDVAGLVRHTGRTAVPAQTAAALVACGETGLEEIVTELIEQVAVRPDGEVIEVMRSLLGFRRQRLIERVLMAARTIPSVGTM